MLYPHQVEGVKWLWSLYALRRGGILADDMGLGGRWRLLVGAAADGDGFMQGRNPSAAPSAAPQTRALALRPPATATRQDAAVRRVPVGPAPEPADPAGRRRGAQDTAGAGGAGARSGPGRGGAAVRRTIWWIKLQCNATPTLPLPSLSRPAQWRKELEVCGLGGAAHEYGGSATERCAERAGVGQVCRNSRSGALPTLVCTVSQPHTRILPPHTPQRARAGPGGAAARRAAHHLWHGTAQRRGAGGARCARPGRRAAVGRHDLRCAQGCWGGGTSRMWRGVCGERAARVQPVAPHPPPTRPPPAQTRATS